MVLFNKQNEKVLTIVPLSTHTVATMFRQPNFYGFFFFNKANGYMTIDQQKNRVGDNTILFYYPFQKLGLEGQFEGKLLQFHPDFFCIGIHAKDIGCQGVLFNNYFNDVLLECTPIEFEFLSNFQQKISKELQRKEAGQWDMISSQIKIFLIEAVRIKLKKQQLDIPVKDDLHHQIEVLIENNYAKEASPEFYAKVLAISLTQFNRLCKKYFQNSFIAILNLKKIAAAKNQLFVSNASIKDIAYENGFNDPFYFTRVFKKHCGISPSEFRNQLKNNKLA